MGLFRNNTGLPVGFIRRNLTIPNNAVTEFMILQLQEYQLRSPLYIQTWCMSAPVQCACLSRKIPIEKGGHVWIFFTEPQCVFAAMPTCSAKSSTDSNLKTSALLVKWRFVIFIWRLLLTTSNLCRLCEKNLVVDLQREERNFSRLRTSIPHQSA